ncbi:MAG: PAS domain-containing sensor histidine kinase, partial [Burkholderiaceae bacterium]
MITDRRTQQFAAIVNATPDAILSIGADHCIVFANPAASQMLRCPLEEMLGATLDRFIPMRFRKAHAEHIRNFALSGVTSRRMAGHMTLTALRADESEFPMEASISQIESDGQTVFTVIMRDITLRNLADEELNYTRTQLRLLTARQRDLREHEQRHVSRELHDDIGQRLSALKMDIAALKTNLPAKSPGLFDTLEAMDELVSDTVGAVRRLASGLRPKILDDLGLAPALETFLNEMQSRFDLQTTLEMPNNLSLSEQESITLFRIVQEAVQNVAKHAQATAVNVSLTANDGHLILQVADNGQGMGADAQRKIGALGLIGMNERVSSANGLMQIHSTLGKGTTI